MADQQDPQLWEYRVETVRTGDVRSFTDHLNRLGADGWELVSTAGTVEEGLVVNSNLLVFTFKRPGIGEFSTDTPWA